MSTTNLARRPVTYLTRAQIAQLWRSLLVSLQCAPGAGPDAQLIELACEVPGWFKAVELGLALECGPSVLWFAANVDEFNRKNHAVEDQHRRSLQAARKHRSAKEVAKDRQRRWRAGVPQKRLQELESSEA